MSEMVEKMNLKNLTPDIDMTETSYSAGYQPSGFAVDGIL